MVFHLPLIAILISQNGAPLREPSLSEQKDLIRRAEIALDIASRVDQFADARSYTGRGESWQVRSQSRFPGERVYEVDMGAGWIDFDADTGSLRSIHLGERRFPPLDRRTSPDEARSLALAYYRAFGGTGDPWIEASASNGSVLHRPGDPSTPFSFDFINRVNGVAYERVGAHIEVEPFGGRLIDLGIDAPPPPVAGKAVVSISSAQAADSAAAAFRRYPGAPASFCTFPGSVAGVRLRVPRFDRCLTELTPYHRAVAAVGQAIPIWSVQIQDASFDERSERRSHFVWGAEIDARTGHCLAIEGPMPLGNGVGVQPPASPVKPAPPFPMKIGGILNAGGVASAKGTIAPCAGTPGPSLKPVTVRVGEGYRTLLLDPKAGLVYADGAAGKPDPALLKALRASSTASAKPFGKG